MDQQPADNTLLIRVVPPVAAVIFFGLFISLGMWQLDRAGQKEAFEAMFAESATHRAIRSDDVPTPFELVEIRGTYLPDRQILIDNIIKNNRLGYYVITPAELSPNAPLLLVNRGWVEKRLPGGEPASKLSAPAERLDLRGRGDDLPKVGIRAGEAFAESGPWPRIAVYPTIDEVAAQLGREVLPWALLLGPDETGGYLREWQPDQSGPWTHYGYAVQWFAMALAVVIISFWQLRKAWGRRA